MDWTNNSVIFSFLNNKKSSLVKECNYCSLKCSCYVDIDPYTTPPYGKQKKTYSDVDEFVEMAKNTYKRYLDGLEYKFCIDRLRVSRCNCVKCLKGKMPCDNVFKTSFEQQFQKAKCNCKKCNSKKTCECWNNHMYMFGMCHTSNIELEKTNINDIAFVITLFQIPKDKYDELKLDDLNFGERINYFLDNYPIYLQTSIYSTINIYDNSFYDIAKEINYYKSRSTITSNPNFEGYDTTLNYIISVESMINKYSNPKTYAVLEPKENPHMTRKRKTPKIRR